MKTWLAGVAALALTASPMALAQGQGNGNGNGKGNEKGNAASVERGNNGQGANKGGPDDRAQRGNSKNSEARIIQQRGNQGNANRGNAPLRVDVRGNGNGKGNGNGNGPEFRVDRDLGGFALPILRETFLGQPRLIDGCPPGLAKKRNGCLPPGQAKKQYRAYDAGFFGLRGLDGGRYFYNDGYLLSYRADGLAGVLPLLAGALGIGNAWPTYYEARPLPRYYESYYRLDDPRGYRYADNVIYRVDPETAAITSIAAMLTGDDIRIGQPMPVGYDVYNVPYAYRDRYYDRPDVRYRYVDGYIYEIDPETMLVASAIDLAI